MGDELDEEKEDIEFFSKQKTTIKLVNDAIRKGEA
jgi:hypothetical protein